MRCMPKTRIQFLLVPAIVLMCLSFGCLFLIERAIEKVEEVTSGASKIRKYNKNPNLKPENEPPLSAVIPFHTLHEGDCISSGLYGFEPNQNFVITECSSGDWKYKVLNSFRMAPPTNQSAREAKAAIKCNQGYDEIHSHYWYELDSGVTIYWVIDCLDAYPAHRNLGQAANADAASPTSVGWDYRRGEWALPTITPTATPDFDKAIQLEPGNPIVYYDRGRYYLQLGDGLKAKDDFTTAIELDLDYADAYLYRGYTHEELAHSLIGNPPYWWKSAIADFTKVIQLEPGNPIVYYDRGRAYWQLGEDFKAIDEYTKAIELDPDYADAYNHRSFVHRDLGQEAEKVADEDKACSLDKQFC